MTKNDSPAVLAPSVDATWRDEFVVELRLQGASGAAIAEALVEVEAHCRESGENATAGFGPAGDYARALDLPDESRWTGPQLVRTWSGLLLLVGGFWITTSGGAALLQGERAEISAGSLVSAGATLILMVLLFLLGDRALRFVWEHAVWAGLTFVAGIGLVVVVALPFQGIILGSVPAAPTLAVGAAMLVAWLVLILVLRRAGKSLDDPLVPPSMALGGDREN